MAWLLGLHKAMEDPNLIVEKTDAIVIIKDKFPKAKYHFLVLPTKDISSLSKVTSDDLPLLRKMEEMAKSVAGRFKSVEFRFGYHMEASMSRLHLHVISQDFDSEKLKTKKHWNSFASNFFMDSKDVIEKLELEGKITLDKNLAKELLKRPLKCHKCSNTFKTMPDLKKHLKHHTHK